MNLLSKLSLALVAVSLLSSPSFAAPKASKTNMTLLTMTVNTSTGKPFTTPMTFQAYRGTSLSAPCSDLTMYSNEKVDEAEFVPEQTLVTSDDFMDEPGPGYSCVAINFIIGEKTYSTGNIELTWDAANGTYVNANPNNITINFEVPGA